MERREAAEYVLNRLKSKGADMVSVIAADGYTEELNTEAGEFSLYRTLFNSALSFKAIKGGKKGTATTNSMEQSAIDDAIASCLAAADAGVVDEFEGIAEASAPATFSSGALVPDRDRLFDLCAEYVASVQKDYPLINLLQFIAQYTRSDHLLLNSNGVDYEAAAGYYSYSSGFTGHDGLRTTSFNGFGTTFTETDTPLMERGLMRSILEDTLNSFTAKSVEGKFVGPIIMTPTCLGEFLYYMASLFIGEGALLQGTAIWRDMLGESVAHPSLSIRQAPLDPRIVCGERFTSEGYISEGEDFIREGVLKSPFHLSRYGALKTGKPRSKNLSGSIIVAAGHTPLSQMIAGIDRGLLVNRFSGGNPAGNGDFSGVAKNSFLVENGKVCGAINETMISGNLEAIFKQIIAISAETSSNGRSILPWVAVDGVTISGAK